MVEEEMGKASKWFRGLLGLKKQDSANSSPKPPKNKRRWSFVKSYRELHQQNHSQNNNTDHFHQHHAPPPHFDAADPNKRAIAVAAATAAVAEAAVAAAQAAAVVVRLTSSSGRCGAAGITATRQEWAAVKIQAAFRGCLARKALRALKGLVKLQALVRGHIERKRTAEELKRMQAVLRAQARVRAGRGALAQILHASNPASKSSSCHLHSPATPEKFESPIRSKSMKHEHSPVLKRNCSKSCVLINGNNKEKCRNKSESHTDEQSWTQERSSVRTCSTNDEKSDRNPEVDSGKPQVASKRRNLFPSTNHHQTIASDLYYSKSWTTTKDSTTSLQSCQSLSCEVQSQTPLKTNLVEESPFCTAENSPQFLSASSTKDNGSKTSPFTPNKSEGSRSYICGYSDYPSYMAYTESSKAKVRSLSAPKQRPQYERTSSSNRYSLNGFGDSRLGTQRVSALQASFSSKAYPGSGRLDKLGMPVGYRY